MPKLLLVEDNEVNREILSLRLQRRGYQIISAVNGAEGVSKALEDQPDLVLMDLHLPVMDGWEAIHQIKANPNRQSIPVIALAVDAIEGNRAQVVAGCDEYITKPIDLPRLLDKIDRLLEKTKSPCQKSPSVPQDRQMQRVLLSYLRHELCTPINAIIGYSDILLNEPKAQQDSSLVSDLQKIYSCGAQLLTLITSILNPSQLEVNQHHWDFQRLGSTIRLELLTPLSTVIGYCEMLLEEAPTDVIPDLDRIHRAAQQLLSMVNDIINLAQQQLQIVEVKGSSASELMMESPAVTALAQNLATTIQSLHQDTFAPVAQGSTILVVDDNKTNCELLSRQLGRQGHTVATAINGQQALRMLKTMPYDLMLLDVVMAGMSGFELLQQLKQHQEWKHIPVIMISALDERDSMVKCIELGAEDYLYKPFNPILLQARIDTCLEKKRLRDKEVQLQQQIAERTLELEREIIERKRAEVAACAANQAKSTFLANMSHELRTPLNVILGFAQLMTRNGSLTPQQQGYLDTICNSGEHLLNLINDVLEISKIEAGRTTLYENTFNLCGLLDSLQQMLRLKAECKGLRLVFDLVPDLPQYIRTDENKLRQVLMNLLGNAIKFTQAGSVTLRVSYRQTPPLMKFAVEDTGPGIAATELESLFEPFVQTEAGRNSQEGSGLGLAISQKFVRLAGGEITVESKLGEGTIFKFDIQTSAVELEELQASEPGQQIIGLELGQPKYRILVAEDKPENRRLLVELLTSVGFEVREAINGQEAIALGKCWSPHLIWMDMRMPVVDGLEATKQIKAAGTQAPVVIALTGNAFEEDRIVALSNGCDDFVRKPFREEDILNKMTQHLGVRYLYGSPQLYSQGIDNSLISLQQSILQPNELKEALTVMPVDWVEQLHQAATKVSTRQIYKLLTQIPRENAHLANALTHLVNNFRFEEIVTLTQQELSPR